MKLIPLTKGKVTQVDDGDYEWLSQYKWCTSVIPSRGMYGITKYYAVRARREDGKRVYMHREILAGAAQVDHIDRDGLNNQRSNLRECTQTQNNMNKVGHSLTSDYKGVSYYPYTRKCWTARIMIGGKGYYLGRYYTEEEAAKVYDTRAKELFGEFARLNFPDVL